MANKDGSSKIIWVDCEMTGLDVNKERVIEIAVAITNFDLTNLVEGPNLVIHQSDELLKGMDEWNTEHHGASGLTQLVRDSKTSERDADKMVLEFVQNHTSAGCCPLAGNSIYMDKMFLMKCMPEFCKHLHYRLIDVTTIKELSKRWCPERLTELPRKKSTHRAIDDVKESIEELQYYRTDVFRIQ